jgi:predicted metalloenzyme YecM
MGEQRNKKLEVKYLLRQTQLQRYNEVLHIARGHKKQRYQLSSQCSGTVLSEGILKGRPIGLLLENSVA